MNQKLLQDDEPGGAAVALEKSSRTSLTIRPSAATTTEGVVASEPIQTNTRSKRSSVVEMWRKREGSMSRGTAPPILPRDGSKPQRHHSAVALLSDTVDSAQHEVSRSIDDEEEGYNFEEKKEQLFDETGEVWNKEIERKQRSAQKGPLNSSLFVGTNDQGNGPQPAHNRAITDLNSTNSPFSPRGRATGGHLDGKVPEQEDKSPGKRSSIRDVWKKRIGGTGTQINQEESPHLKYNQSQTLQIPRKDIDTAGETKTRQESPASRNSEINVRNSGNQRDFERSSLVIASSFGSGTSDNAGSNVGSNVGSNAGSIVHLTPRGNVLDRWTKRGQPASTSVTNNASSPSPSKDFKGELSTEKRASAFSDLRAQWAKHSSDSEQIALGASKRSVNSSPVALGSPTVSNGQDRLESLPAISKIPFTEENKAKNSSHCDESKVRNAGFVSQASQRRHSIETETPSSGEEQSLESSKQHEISSVSLSKSGATQSNITSCSSPPTGRPCEHSNDGNAEGNSTHRKSNHFLKMGQRHASRVKSPADIKSDDVMLKVSTTASSAGNSAIRQTYYSPSSEPTKKDQAMQPCKPNSNVGKFSRGSENGAAMTGSGKVVKQKPSSESAFSGKKFNDKKMMMLAKHRHRVKTGRVTEAVVDDISVDSSALSQAFLDAVPDDEQDKLSRELTTIASNRSQVEDAVLLPSLQVQTLLACGADDDKLIFAQPGYDGSTVPTSPVSQSEYASLCVSNSDSFVVSDYIRNNPASPSLTSEYGLQRLYDNGDISVQSSRSGEGSGSYLQKSNGASKIADRAGRMLRGKRQKNSGSVKEKDFEVHDSEAHRRGQSSPEEMQSDDDHDNMASADESALSLQDSRDDSRQDSERNHNASHENSYDQFDDEPQVNIPRTKAVELPERNLSFETDTETEASSHVISTSASEADSRIRVPNSSTKENQGRKPIYSKELVTDDFVTESNSNVTAFKSAYKSLSLKQLADDLTEEVAGTMMNVRNLDFKQLASNLNEGMSAASESLSKLVGTEVFPKGKLKVPRRELNPVEEGIAIEVEYIEDSDDDSA